MKPTKTKNEDQNEDLAKKLNVPTEGNAFILHPPKDYSLDGAKTLASLSDLASDIIWVQSFYDLESSLTNELPVIKEHLAKEGCLWLCWPKRSANKGSDLNDTIVRALGIACGLVDNKMASIKDIYSGLKFVYRKKDR